MNRTDRLYAIVEQLRAIAPATRSVRELAAHFEVSTRTIERDVLALQESGVPIWSNTGRRGGLGIDTAYTLPPLNFTVAEAVAIGVALSRDTGSPFSAAGASALRKVAAVLPSAGLRDATSVTDRVRIITSAESAHDELHALPARIGEAIVHHRVVNLCYEDRAGAITWRPVEPIGLVLNGQQWYLVGWCRLRDDERAFRLDRVQDVELTDEVAPARPFDLSDEELQRLARAVRWT